MLLFFGGATHALLEFELQSVFGRRRMDREISRLSEHYIICGAGAWGAARRANWRANLCPSSSLTRSEEKLARYTSEGWLTLAGRCHPGACSAQLRIEHARGLVAATTTDAINIYIILTARSLNPKLNIIARAARKMLRST